MTLNIALSPEDEVRLKQQAAAAGLDPGTFVRKTIERQLATDPHQAPSGVDDPHGALTVSTEEWLARLNAWASNHKPLTHFVDDSRESIYEGRD
jgi:hypothetical protein